MCKKGLVVCLAVLLFGVGQAGADDLTLDVSGSYASEPFPRIGGAFGVGLGSSYDLVKITNIKNLKARADISYYSFSRTETGDFFGEKEEDKQEATMIPLFLGARYGVPMETFWVFGDFGLEISRESYKFTSIIGGGEPFVFDDYTTTAVGLGIGAGFEYPISEAIVIGINARYHTNNGYFTISPSLGYKMPM